MLLQNGRVFLRHQSVRETGEQHANPSLRLRASAARTLARAEPLKSTAVPELRL